jgi:long-chain fatty acid transport protein
MFFLPQFYLSHPLSSQVTGGFGVFTPFGVATDWPKDWEGRFQVTHAAIQATVVNPTLAWKPAPWVSLAGGVDIAYVMFELERGINWSQVGEVFGPGPLSGNPEGTVLLRGSTTATGFHSGVLFTPADVWALGLSFRSRLHAEIRDGSADFSIPPPVFPPALQAAFSDGRMRTEIDLPPSVRTGVLVRPAANWNVEFDAVWTGWSSVDDLVVDFKQGLPSDRTPFSWQDVMAYSVGTEYRWSPWILRAGYTYDLAPIPDDTLSPILADGDRQWFSTGVGYRRGNWSFDLAYQYILFSRSKLNDFGATGSSAGTPPAIPSIDARANGTYSSRVGVLGLGASFRF